MKTLERQFFRYVMRQINYDELEYNIDFCKFRKPMRNIANDFMEKKNCSYKQLVYYMDKWSRYGFYDYGISLDLGHIEYNKIPDRYKSIIPERVISKIQKTINKLSENTIFIRWRFPFNNKEYEIFRYSNTVKRLFAYNSYYADFYDPLTSHNMFVNPDNSAGKIVQIREDGIILNPSDIFLECYKKLESCKFSAYNVYTNLDKKMLLKTCIMYDGEKFI